jgi:ribosomally synthesized peptide (two-chain TOMM family)
MAMNNGIPSYESLLELQEVYLRAIALAWRDPEFKQALLADATDALARYFDYRSPWLVDLTVKEPEPQQGFGWDPKTGTWTLPPHAMTFGVPTRPADTAEEPIALAAYNDAGPAYLFTCC